MKFVEYHEPDEYGNDVTVRITTEEAITRAKHSAAAHNYQYLTDQDALEDFLTVHWANLVGRE